MNWIFISLWWLDTSLSIKKQARSARIPLPWVVETSTSPHCLPAGMSPAWAGESLALLPPHFISKCQLQLERCMLEHIIKMCPASAGRREHLKEKPSPIPSCPSRDEWRDRTAVPPSEDSEESFHLPEIQQMRSAGTLHKQWNLKGS